MRMHLIRHLDWELLVKEPSAWPTSCNLSASSPMTVPITDWASEGLASLMLLQHSRLFPLPALLFPQILSILQVLDQMPLLQRGRR